MSALQLEILRHEPETVGSKTPSCQNKASMVVELRDVNPLLNRDTRPVVVDAFGIKLYKKSKKTPVIEYG